MMTWAGSFRNKNLFPLVVGPVDGILTALTLAAGHLLSQKQPIDLSLSFRIAAAASLSGGFVFFVAEYARLRSELVDAGRHLNLNSAGKLATSALGRDVLRESIRGTAVASIGSFAGAMLPLAVGTAFGAISWLTIAVALIVLGLFGIIVGRLTHGDPVYWAAALVITGVVLSGIGSLLHIA